MIPLSEIDYATVLHGARVPLHHPHNAPDFRVEWNVDRIINIGDTHSESNVLTVRQSAEYLAFVSCGTLTLDSTNPDVARLLDRRIAEAIKVKRSIVELGIATEMGRETFVIHTLGGWIPIQRKAYRGVKVTADNIPAARAAMIKALYPVKP